MTSASTSMPTLPAANVYLSFDDGPDAYWTPIILEQLATAQAHATFFMLGQQARKLPLLVKQVVRQGHGIGNHGWAHPHPWTLTSAQLQHDLRAGGDCLADITGTPPQLFRPPYGRVRAATREQAQASGQRIVLWNLSAVDWGWFSQLAAIERRLARVQAEDIVLMHDAPNAHNRPERLTQVLPNFLHLLATRHLSTALL